MWRIIKYSLFFLAGIILLFLLWGVLIEPRIIDEETETVEIPNLPAAWEDKRIAVIADLQVGMWFDNTDTVSRIIETLVEERPAVVLIAGDFIYHPTDDDNPEEARREAEGDRDDIAGEIRKVVALLRPLAEAKIPVYAVLGNHDYAMQKPNSVKLEWVAQEVESALEANGIKVLQNEAVPLLLANESTGESDNISKDKEPPLYLIGVGSHYAERSRPLEALQAVPPDAARVAFMHNPDSFTEFPPHSIPLAVAAHTHGGQLRLPLLPEWSWISYKVKGEAHADGWIDGFGQAGNRLYVNRGIGFSLVPIRINCPPELTYFTLRSKKTG